MFFYYKRKAMETIGAENNIAHQDVNAGIICLSVPTVEIDFLGILKCVMKRYFFLLASVILLACSENGRMVYDEHMHDIYYSIVTDTGIVCMFPLLMADPDSGDDRDPKMLGNVLTKPQKFKVEGRVVKRMPKKVYIMKNFPEFYEFPGRRIYLIKCLCG